MKNIPTELINIIEPYTRNIQEKELLYDIRNYVKTLNILIDLYKKIIYKKYNRGIYIYDYKLSAYAEILMSFSQISILNSTDMYKFYENTEINKNAKYIIRSIWGKKKCEERNEIVDILMRNAYKKPLKPSDSRIYHGL